jgi:hypothetical protein
MSTNAELSREIARIRESQERLERWMVDPQNGVSVRLRSLEIEQGRAKSMNAWVSGLIAAVVAAVAGALAGGVKH